MLIERRDFLKTTIGAVSGMAVTTSFQATAFSMTDSQPNRQTEHGQALAAFNDWDLLGIPKSGQDVRQGLYPFTPKRTFILDRECHVSSSNSELTKLSGKTRSADKTLRVFQATSALSRAYGVPERAEKWGRRLLVWLVDYYGSFAQDHHWLAPQSCQGFAEQVRTSNAVVDWWLILIPEGIETSSIDGTRLHTLIIPIFNKAGQPRLPAEFWDCMTRAVGIRTKPYGGPQTVDRFWRVLSRKGAMSACLALNQRIAHNLA